MNQQFPQGDSLAQQHAIRLLQDGQRKEQPLQTAMGNSYPLIIRLEALTEQAAAQGKELQQVRIECLMRLGSAEWHARQISAQTCAHAGSAPGSVRCNAIRMHL